MSTHSSFLKEMGITEWTSREGSNTEPSNNQPSMTEATVIATTNTPTALENAPKAHWWFFGNQPQGDAQLLFQNVVRVLGLSRNEWSWKSPNENLASLVPPEGGVPVVAFAFGGPTVQKITGERDPLPQLRETILALNTGNEDEIPVVATFDLAQLATKSKEKALLWQDLLLAKSVLQNI
jgi:DNA polymerase